MHRVALPQNSMYLTTGLRVIGQFCGQTIKDGRVKLRDNLESISINVKFKLLPLKGCGNFHFMHAPDEVLARCGCACRCSDGELGSQASSSYSTFVV